MLQHSVYYCFTLQNMLLLFIFDKVTQDIYLESYSHSLALIEISLYVTLISQRRE